MVVEGRVRQWKPADGMVLGHSCYLYLPSGASSTLSYVSLQNFRSLLSLSFDWGTKIA
jgi:hypothetical protein